MKRHRFIVDFDPRQRTIAITDPELLHQWKRVLRLRTGDEVILVSQSGDEAHAVIDDIADTMIACHIRALDHNTREPKVSVRLYCAMLKRENFELVVQKATEVGVKTIVPVITTRTVKLGVRLDRLERIAREAAEQCGRASVPQIGEPLNFAEAINDAGQCERVYFFDTTDAEVFHARTMPESVGLFVGPEGGWDDTERAEAKKAGFTFATLGPLVLRAETAAIVASYEAVVLSQHT